MGLSILLCAAFSEKDLALGLLQTAVAQLIPQPLSSIPAEKLWNHLQELQEPQETQEAAYRWAPAPHLPFYSQNHTPISTAPAAIVSGLLTHP